MRYGSCTLFCPNAGVCSCREVCPKENNRTMGLIGKMKDLMAINEWGEKHRGTQNYKTTKMGPVHFFFWNASLSSEGVLRVLLRNSSDNLAEEWAHLIWKGSTRLHSSIFTCGAGDTGWKDDVLCPHRRAVLVLAGSWWRVTVTCLMQMSLQTQTQCWESARAPDTGLYLGGLIIGMVFSKHSSRLHLPWMRLHNRLKKRLFCSPKHSLLCQVNWRGGLSQWLKNHCKSTHALSQSW